MTETKYTRDGKKVAVIGKLNNEEWIVQEIYVADGKEFPAGENFTTKTLLDKPAETYHSRRQKEQEQCLKSIEGQIEKAHKQRQIAERKATAARLINYATQKYADIDLEQLDTLFAFLSGEITHIITRDYSEYRIEFLVDAVEATNSDSWCHISSDGLRLVSLFGCRESGEREQNDRNFRLDWRINKYRDASGNWTPIYPCKSYEQAVKKLDELISQEENASEKLIKTKQKYNLQHPSEEKISAYYQRVAESKKKSVENTEKKFEEAKAELEEALKLI